MSTVEIGEPTIATGIQLAAPNVSGIDAPAAIDRTVRVRSASWVGSVVNRSGERVGSNNVQAARNLPLKVGLERVIGRLRARFVESESRGVNPLHGRT